MNVNTHLSRYGGNASISNNNSKLQQAAILIDTADTAAIRHYFSQPHNKTTLDNGLVKYYGQLHLAKLNILQDNKITSIPHYFNQVHDTASKLVLLNDMVSVHSQQPAKTHTDLFHTECEFFQQVFAYENQFGPEIDLEFRTEIMDKLVRFLTFLGKKYHMVVSHLVAKLTHLVQVALPNHLEPHIASLAHDRYRYETDIAALDAPRSHVSRISHSNSVALHRS